MRRSTEEDPPAGGAALPAALPQAAPPARMPAALANFEGLPNISGNLPPDPTGDVGPNHYVQMTNVFSAIFNKSGAIVLGPFPNNTFWAGFGGLCQTENNGDPIVLYDQQADRWFVSQFALPAADVPRTSSASPSPRRPIRPGRTPATRSRSTSSPTTPSTASGPMTATDTGAVPASDSFTITIGASPAEGGTLTSGSVRISGLP